MDVDRYTLTYPGVRALVEELRGLGAQNALAARARGLTGRRRRAALEAAYAAAVDADGRVPATVEVVYGQAWCPGATPPVRGRRGESVVSLERLRRR
jgi:malonyl-CoA O-methyltransferase